ncbi:TauD/TfdA family dioxygenase [Actinosynnema sp. NPDC047251]|uniref:Taurine dioxygenase n=1 Tax=Saccharothrix espanaensis (strain ATCC 51144 / DSM 44229 / JCM 9112 / NBRC 15066 / NRRL 15764) TaxID=1179773 RepID=K0JQG0_SACES|nr:TauD/TfdA family dioxygenase [Saccharothrix espanaensis]CCH29565.1 Taurine dioxygenase [Saccharothrix espanaensis DSM 44229]
MRHLEVDREVGGWWSAHGDEVESCLDRDGGVVLDGPGLTDVANFQVLAELACGPLSRDNPEHPLVGDDPTGTVNRPVEYSSKRKLLWHNENTFATEWPRRIAFGCQRAADRGETPTVDMTAVYEELTPAVRGRFEELGVTYVRRLGTDLGLDWPTVYGTTDRQAVERRCERDGARWEWSDDGRVLTTWQRRAAVITLPGGRRSFVAQVLHWHPRALDEDVHEAMAALMPPGEFPKTCTFGDGSPIPDEDVVELLTTCDRLEEVVGWTEGRVMLLDNLRRAHARNPYTGERRLLVAIGRAVDHATAGSGHGG